MGFSQLAKEKIISAIPLQNYILFESVPDFSDNTLSVFTEMVRRGFHRKYRLVWMMNNETSVPPFEKAKNVECVYRHSKIGRYYRKTAKYMISCNDFLANVRDGQYSLFLNHGTALKTTSKYYVLPETITQVLAASDEANNLTSRYFKYDKSKSIVLGFPRNDAFALPPRDLKTIFGSYRKFIVWYPTFRQRKGGFGSACENALPLIYNEQAAKSLNASLTEKNTLLVIKPHFAQDISRINKMNLSHIHFIDDHFFPENKISSYEFLNSCDALITDYSSVYYDYLLADKPIAVVWEDIQEYLKFPGLIDNYEYYLSGAEKIFNLDDFVLFINHVSQEIDSLKETRNQLKTLMNYASDGKNTARVVDYLESIIR